MMWFHPSLEGIDLNLEEGLGESEYGSIGAAHDIEGLISMFHKQLVAKDKEHNRVGRKVKINNGVVKGKKKGNSLI